MNRFVRCAALLAGSFASWPALAQALPFGPDLAGAGWRTMSFRGLNPTTFAPTGASALSIRAEQGVSLIWREVPAASQDRMAARWRWRVSEGPPPTDLARRGADDRAAAVYFLFARDAASAEAGRGAGSLDAALRRSGGAALIYVWGGAGAAGAVVASPHLGSSGKLVIRRPAGGYGPGWREERVDLAGDFRRAFGREPGPLVGVAISADSDDTKTVIQAEIEGLRLD